MQPVTRLQHICRPHGIELVLNEAEDEDPSPTGALLVEFTSFQQLLEIFH